MKELLNEAMDIAREAGQLVLEYQRSGFAVEIKPDQSPVTIADRKAEELIIKRLNRSFPEDAILGEEHGRHEGRSGKEWVIDPIDGTRSFVRGVPLFGTMIALMEGERSILGVVYIPALDEMVGAAKGTGCLWNGNPARVSTVNRLDQALAVTSQIRGIHRLGIQNQFNEFLMQVGMFRTWGDCYGYVMVATGRADICFDTAAHLWDMAPVCPIIEEAGGRFTALSGEATVYANNGLATNGLLHEEALRYLRTDTGLETE
ncbi:MAG TPA: inositol monophosphatase family protein [bacterium]|nr:inositol monophosphatase family protein [bacterium]